MGRMLETLKRGENWREEEAKILPLGPTQDPLAHDEADTTSEEAFPFIEVGGPGKKVEASPEILALMLPPSAQKETLPTPAAPSPAGKVAAVLREPPPVNVAFDPWPAKPAPRPLAAEVIVYHHPEHALSQQYHGLFGKLVEVLGPGEAAAWLFCGRAHQVGNTTVLLNLAAAGGLQNKHRLVVVDANLRRPALGQRLGMVPGSGVGEVLVGAVGPEQAVQATMVQNLHVLPAGTSKAGSPSPWTAEAAGWLLAWLRERFDLVLVDGPCLEEKSDLAALAPPCAGLFLVTPHNETAGLQQGSLARALARLGGKLRGVIQTHLES